MPHAGRGLLCHAEGRPSFFQDVPREKAERLRRRRRVPSGSGPCRGRSGFGVLRPGISAHLLFHVDGEHRARNGSDRKSIESPAAVKERSGRAHQPASTK